jgi:acetyl esterase/lipase
MKLAAAASSSLLLISSAAFAATEINLWPVGQAPGSEGKMAKEKIEPPEGDRKYTRVTAIHNPTITAYLPPKEKATGAAMVVAPGGAHRFLAMHEGDDVGEWLASRGIAAFVLKYRLGREEGSTYKVDVHPQLDAHRAIRTVRARAAEWRVDAARVGIMGFSAGGEVALRSSLAYDAGKPDAADPVERFSSKPNFQVLVYPGIRSAPLDAIGKDTPATFLICTHDDASPAERIPNLYLALLKAGVPAEMHVYSRGGHGYGIRPRPLPVSSWTARLEEWLADTGMLKPLN